MKKVLKLFLLLTFALSLCACTNDKGQDYKKMVVIQDLLYTETNEYVTSCDESVNWIIESSVRQNVIPTENLSSNFGVGIKVCLGHFNNQVYVKVDEEKWQLFEIVGSWSTLTLEVEEVKDNTILAGEKLDDGSYTNEYYVHYPYVVSMPSDLKAGDKITITYDGYVLESYPAIIGAYKIEYAK